MAQNGTKYGFCMLFTRPYTATFRLMRLKAAVL